MRIKIIDGFRGFFLINMMIVHLNEYVRAYIWKPNHHEFGWVEDAQGFVFLSGLVIGLVYGKAALRSSLSKSTQKLWSRIFKITYYHIALILFILCCALTMPQQAEILDPRWSFPFLTSVLSILLLIGPKFINILPMYIIFMAFTPLALSMLMKGKTKQLLLISVGVWLLSQTGLVDLVLSGISDQIGLTEKGIVLGLPFDRFAWQIFFFFGLAGGYLMAEGRLDLSFMHSEAGRKIFIACAVLFLLFFGSKIYQYADIYFFQSSGNHIFSILFDRTSISFLRVLNFAVDVYLIVWILQFGERWRFTGFLKKVLSVVMSWRPMTFLGQHSLQVYSFHVFLFYGIYFFFDGNFSGFSQIGRSLIVLVAVLLLYLPAYVHAEYYKIKSTAKQKTAT